MKPRDSQKVLKQKGTQRLPLEPIIHISNKDSQEGIIRLHLQKTSLRVSSHGLETPMTPS